MKIKHLLSYFLFFFSFYSVSAQSIQSISPVIGKPGTTIDITITGTETYFTDEVEYNVSSGDNFLQVSDIKPLSDTVAIFKLTIPLSAKTGFYDLEIKMRFYTLKLKSAFVVAGGKGNTNRVVNINPAEGKLEESVVMRITFENTLKVNPQTSKVYLTKEGVAPIPFITVYSLGDSALGAIINIPYNATPGRYSLLIASVTDSLIILPGVFEIKTDPDAARLLSVEPGTAIRGDTLTMRFGLTGTRMKPNMDIRLYFPSTIKWQDVKVLNDTTLTVKVNVTEDAAIGLYDMAVSDFNGSFSATLNESFTVKSKGGLLSVSPDVAKRGDWTNLVIKGSGTRFLRSGFDINVAIYSADTFFKVDEFYVESDTEIQVSTFIPENCPLGLYHVGVLSGWDGFIELQDSFTVSKYSGVNNVYSGKKRITVYPNPVKDILTFETDRKVHHVYLADLMGRQTELPLADIRQNSSAYTINMMQYGVAKGVYFIKIETDLGTTYQKILIQ